MKEYPATQQTRLADEIEAAPSDAIWPRWIADYVTHRDACRAIERP